MKLAIVDSDEDLRLLLAQLLSIGYPTTEILDFYPTEVMQNPRLIDGVSVLIVDMAATGVIAHHQNSLHPGPCIGLWREARLAAQIDGMIATLATTQITRAALEQAMKLALAELDRVTRSAIAMCTELEVLASTQPLANIGDEAPPPITIRGYKARRFIGRGAMATVYAADRLSDGHTVAIKILDADLSTDEVQVKRFMNEFSLQSKIQSVYVARIHEHGFTDDHIYIVMEYFPGGDLKRLLGTRISPRRALIFFYQLAVALEDIHRCGILHRDLKPQNIMFRADRSVVLMDFGLSRGLDFAQTLTMPGEVLGTPHYMSPEQGAATTLDARSDLYSLGAIFFEMLTGHKPYRADSLIGLLYNHANAPVPKLPSRLAVFQPVIDRTLAKAPDDRFSSAAELLDYVRHRWANNKTHKPATVC